MIIHARMFILSEYPNNKKMFIQFTSTTYLFTNFKRVGLYPMRNKEKSASSTELRKKSKLQLHHKQKWTHLMREEIAGTEVTRKSPVLLIRSNKVRSMGSKEAVKEVVPE